VKDDAVRNGTDGWKKRQRASATSRTNGKWLVQNLHTSGNEGLSEAEIAAFREFKAARSERDRLDAEKAATDLDEQQIADGQVAECGCCFDDVPRNRLIGCDGGTTHYFCRPCLSKYVDNIIGKGAFTLECMSSDSRDPCLGGFSQKNRNLIMDEKQTRALDRLEMAASLRLAEVPGLETCPYCPFAMEYPPVTVDREFRCLNPECEIVSCRLCRKKTHIPKTCQEAVLEETGHSGRHTIEEAMSDAIIRRCKQCEPLRILCFCFVFLWWRLKLILLGDYPYIKTDGCNKICCTRCSTLQCYVCRETVKDYSHFDDSRHGRNGRPGQCPLFDSTDVRHKNEAQEAEKTAREKVLQDNPDVVSGYSHSSHRAF
jgi:E3 ubiquitin-protein ligase RNF216